MKKLENRSERIERPSEIHRRDFFKAVGAVAGVAALEYIFTKTGTGSLFLPREAHAQEAAATRRVGDRDVRVIPLDRSLSTLDRETQPYRRAEVQPSERNPNYSVDVVVPQENMFLVVLNNRDDVRRLAITIGGREDDGFVANLNDFAAMVQRVSGTQLSRVKIILERGTEQRGGRTQSYTNAYILPINSRGDYITNLGSNEYLIHGASRRGDRVTTGSVVIRDHA